MTDEKIIKAARICKETPKGCDENCPLYRKEPCVIAFAEYITKRSNRDTPKKPIEVQGAMGDFTLSCPSCKKPIVNCYSSRTFEPEFCICCGQRLLWSRKDGGAENDKP